MTLEILSFDPVNASTTELTDYYRVIAASVAHDQPNLPVPSFETVIGHLQTPFDGRGQAKFWNCRQEGLIVGILKVELPEEENRHMALLEARVRPDYRRTGIATELLRFITPYLEQYDRTTVSALGVAADGPGVAWALGVGFQIVHCDVLQLLEVAGVDRDKWTVPAPSGYKLHYWMNEAPNDFLESYAVARSAIEDAPTEDSSFEVTVWDPARIRRRESDLLSQGTEQHIVVAIDDSTGAVVGLTEIQIFGHRPSHGFQHDTAVLAAHRGHGLGRAMKAAMLSHLADERPRLEQIATSTAAENTAMIHINHQLGFQTIRSMVDLEQATSNLSRRLRELA